MSDASAPPAKPSVAKRGFGVVKLAFGGLAGLATGVIGVYATAIVDKVAKPPKPVANFGCTADGLTVTCNNLASGQTGWWDFGDGATLEPFNPDEKQVTHTYEKPGNYTVKLVVRNFLNEENDRAVGVDVTAGTKATGGPVVTALTVEPVGSGTAPATFRVKGVVQNAQKVLLDPGTDLHQPEKVPAGGGTFERIVVYEQPGVYPYMVFAENGEKVSKLWKPVEVKAPPAGALSVVLKVTDTGTKVERTTKPTTVPIRVPEKPAGAFERVILPDAGSTFADAKLGAVTSKAVKNVKAELAGDKKTLKISGEWTGTVEAVNRAAGGSDVMIPLTLTQEKSSPYTGTPQTVAVPLAFAGSFSLTSDDWTSGTMAATVKLPDPPAGVVISARKVAVDVHEMTVAAGKLVDKYVIRIPELTKPAEEYAVQLSNGERRVVRTEKASANELKVTVRPNAAANTRAGK
jgi:PKD repeat protein